jgi:glycosyltransferase involved in cell wall biosynthesis
MTANDAARTAPTISFGLPVYNGALYLRRALDDILAQTYTDFELIISDNASTDATAQIIREYAKRDPRIRRYRQKINIGVGNNWTFVAEQARGKFFKWVSANDEYEPTLTADCLAVMERDPTVVLCYGRTQFIDLGGARMGLYPEDFAADSTSPLERYRTVRKYLNLCTPLQAGVIRRDALRRCRYLGNYRDSDRVLIAGLALEGRIVLLPKVHFYRRWGEAVATPLRTPLQVTQMYRPEATRTPLPLFENLPRHLGQLGIALRTPRSWREKVHSLITALYSTDWRRKFRGDVPPSAPRTPTLPNGTARLDSSR